MTIGALGIGTIGPAARLAAGRLDKTRIADFLAALTDDASFSHTDYIIPRKCVDGRPRLDGAASLGPDAAGGTVSLVVGDALTCNQWRNSNEAAPEHTKRAAEYWITHNQQVGGHTAQPAHGGSGCGACDKLADALLYIVEHDQQLRVFINGLGVAVEDETHTQIITAARQLLTQKYSGDGNSILAALREAAGEDAVEVLTGEHNEIALIVNTKSNTTLDRAKLAARYGGDLQAFNVDVWALEASAKVACANASERRAFLYAMLCYNVAVAAVLSDPSLLVVVR